MAWYLDTSAAMKLVVHEEHSDALVRWVDDDQPVLAASDLVVTELLRGIERRAPDRRAAARLVLDRCALVTITTADFFRAATLDPASMRTLDALHLACALSLAPLDGFVTYDDRLAEAATHHGLRVLAPA